MKKYKIFGVIGGIAILAFVVIFVGMKLIDNAGKTSTQITREDTVSELNKYVEKKVDLTVKDNPTKGTVDFSTTSLEDEVPDIEKYLFKVRGSGEIDIEIFSSPEKAGSETNNDDPKEDTWLIETVKEFNRQGFTVDGKTVSVSLRSVSSGLACDYIYSGKYVPDGFSPSNEDWASMLKAKGIKLNQEAKSLVGNVAGIIIDKDTYNTMIKKYGVVNLETILAWVIFMYKIGKNG